MKCEYCGGDIPYNTNQCPHCSAACKFVPAPRNQYSCQENSQEDPSAVKPFPVIDVSMLDSSKEEIADQNVAIEEEGEDEDYQIAKKGCGLIFIVFLLLVIIIFCVNNN